MPDDYKEKLKKFIADIPPAPAQIISGEPKKPPYSQEFKDKVNSVPPGVSLPTNPLFKKYTGIDHFSLVKNWVNGGRKTTCNEFVARCGWSMGAKVNLGRFPIKDFLQQTGKGHAWVPGDSGKKPNYGDIFRRSDRLHMGVSLGFEGGVWLTVEAGQGGPDNGYDALGRKRTAFDPNVLLGWCDMRLYLDPRPPLPDWVIGMWVIYSGDETYYYRINKYFEASQYLWAPSVNMREAVPIDTGSTTYEGTDFISVVWDKEGGTERFKYDRFESFPGIMERMTGFSNSGEPLRGVRL